MAAASFIAKALLPVVADMLIDRFKDQRDDLLPRNSLITALGKLNKIGIFSEVAEVIGGNSNPSIDDLDDVVDAVGLFQRSFGLSTDGAVGKVTFDALKTIIGCLDNRSPGSDAPSITVSDKNELRYHVKGDLPDVSGGNTMTLIEDAWGAWTQVCTACVQRRSRRSCRSRDRDRPA